MPRLTLQHEQGKRRDQQSTDDRRCQTKKDSKVRVAYICADAGVPVFGTKGCSVHVQEIINQFLQRDAQVTLFCLRCGGENCFSSKDLEVQEFSLESGLGVDARELQQTRAAEDIAAQLTAAEFDLVYERYSLWSASPMVRTQELGIPSVLEVNAPLIEEQLQHRELVHHAEALALRDSAFRAATTIITVSENVGRYVKSCLPQSQHAKVHVVPNGVDTARFRPDVPPLRSTACPTIGFLGTLKPWHGLESLLSAFQLVRHSNSNVRLRVIGDGPMRESLQEQVLTESPELTKSIEWIGAVHPGQVPGHLTSLDVAVAPYLDSADFYFSPLKVYEYMAAGRAVVASAIGQLQNVIEHGQTGMLYSPGNVAELASQLSVLVDRPMLRQQLGQAARQVAIQRHSWQHTLTTILGLVAADRSRLQRGMAPAVALTSNALSGAKG